MTPVIIKYVTPISIKYVTPINVTIFTVYLNNCVHACDIMAE